MRQKYLMEIINEDMTGNEYSYKTRADIADDYNIPLYIVDKMIKMSVDTGFKMKRKCHKIFQEFMDTHKITHIKPGLRD